MQDVNFHAPVNWVQTSPVSSTQNNNGQNIETMNLNMITINNAINKAKWHSILISSFLALIIWLITNWLYDYMTK